MLVVNELEEKFPCIKICKPIEHRVGPARQTQKEKGILISRNVLVHVQSRHRFTLQVIERRETKFYVCLLCKWLFEQI